MAPSLDHREGSGNVMESALAIGIHGAAGRMGTRLLQLTAADPGLELAAALEHPSHPLLGKDAGVHSGQAQNGVTITTLDALKVPVDVMIDFSHPEGSIRVAEFCAERGIPLVIGTTGLEPSQKATIAEHGKTIPLLMAPNMSRAVNLLEKLVVEAARVIGKSADIEIVERHHRLKKDAPSGTALRLADVAAQAIGQSDFVYGRHGIVGERPNGEIGVHALRTGDNPGEHTVVFGLMGECLELTHRALNRDGFVRGALDAAKFLKGKPAGLYSMADVLA